MLYYYGSFLKILLYLFVLLIILSTCHCLVKLTCLYLSCLPKKEKAKEYGDSPKKTNLKTQVLFHWGTTFHFKFHHIW